MEKEIQRINFLLSIQQRIDAISIEFGNTHPEVIKLKNKFGSLANTAPTDTGVKSHGLSELKLDTSAIRGHLEIRANNSISFDYITNERIRNQLLKDNIRMENIRLDHFVKDENSRFYSFCVNAFYQIEELINYYYSQKYALNQLIANISKLNKITKDYTSIKSIAQINISEKIYLIENEFYYGQSNNLGKPIYYDSTINKIRNVRNEDVHRCSVIIKDELAIRQRYQALKNKIRLHNSKNSQRYIKNEDEKLIEKEGKLLEFIQNKNYDLIRETISDLNEKVKSSLSP